jgi:hypothetical protein
MELKEIISVTGKPGLYKVIAQSGKGFIVESLDPKKTRFPVSANHQVALLDEITVYANAEDNLTLKSIFENMVAKQDELAVPGANDEALKIKNYFKEVAPNHDEDRVYISDMKKILKWYEILNTSGVLTASEEEEKEEQASTEENQESEEQ